MKLMYCVMMSQGKHWVLGKCACIIHPPSVSCPVCLSAHRVPLLFCCHFERPLKLPIDTEARRGRVRLSMCVSVYKSCIGAVSACTLGQMSVSRVHLLKQTAVALHMWPPFFSVALEAVRVLTHCVSELPIFTQPQTTYILARHTNALPGVHTHF